jgi:steroid 5-alpha reductase family enzyme
MVLPKKTPSTAIRGGASTPSSELNSAVNHFDNGPFWQGAGIISGINALGYLITVTTGSHLHVDLLGTGAFAAAALPSLLSKKSAVASSAASPPFRVQASASAVLIWSAKLSSFLFYRACVSGHDNRLEETLADPVSAGGFWIISAAWGIVCSLPHLLGATSSGPGHVLTSRVGLGMYAAGLLIETVADAQKWLFKSSNPSGTFCNAGLWSLSQHPNWFGNLLLWSGIFLLNAPALVEPPANKLAAKPGGSSSILRWLAPVLRYKRVALAALSPLFMWALFNGQATGTITNGLELANAKYGYGTNVEYTKYVDSTPLIVPFTR